MNDPTRREDLLEVLSADAPARRMRRRFEQLLEEPPRRTVAPVAWAGLAAIFLLMTASLLLLTRGSTSPPADESGTLALVGQLQAPSTFDRLQALQAAAELSEFSPGFERAIVAVIEHDVSVNVRVSAVDVLLDKGLPSLAPESLQRVLLDQQTAIVQAHLGYRMRHRGVISKADLERILASPEIAGTARDALLKLEES